MSKKTYVLDTNVLMSDGSSLFAFQDNDIIIPMVVLEELDRHKTRSDEAGKNARYVNRALDELRSVGSLLGGVSLVSGGTLRVVSIDQSFLSAMPSELREPKADNLIIALALFLKNAARELVPDHVGPTLISKDINVRVKCDAVGVRAEDYVRAKPSSADGAKKLYTGVDTLEVQPDLIDAFYNDQPIVLTSPELRGKKLRPNEIVVLKTIVDGVTTKSAIARFVSDASPLQSLRKVDDVFGMRPRNKEQTFSLDLLLDEKVQLVTLAGPAGTGKTLIALAAALSQVKGIGNPATARYDKLIVTKPVHPVGRDIGFLPGTLEEKMEPWIAPIRDNLASLLGTRTGRPRNKKNNDYGKPHRDDGSYLSILQDKGIVEIEAIAFIRGRSIPNAIILLDEAQNTTPHEIKTIVTRMGEGSKLIMTGDIEQIDREYLDVYSNGLTYLVEKFKDQQIAGHVLLLKGERSILASIASQIL